MQLNFKRSKFARIMRSFEEIGCECHSEVLVTSCSTCSQVHLTLKVLCFGWISCIDCRYCYFSCIYRVSDHQVPWTLPTTIEQNPIHMKFSKSLGFQKCLWKIAWSRVREIHVWSHPRQLVSLGSAGGFWYWLEAIGFIRFPPHVCRSDKDLTLW